MENHVATQSTGESQINQINLWMRQQPWYIEFFRSKGLNPNQVKLTDQQRNELTMIATRNGVQLGDRMKIDSAGNVNQMGGFAGMPTWAKVAIAAAPAAATAGFGLAGMGPLGGALGGGGGAGVGASGTGAGLSAASNFAAQGASPLLGGGTLAAGAGAAVPTIGSTAIGSGMGTTPSLAGSTAAGAGSAGAAGALGAAGASGALSRTGQYFGDRVGEAAADGGLKALLQMIPALAGILPALMANGESEADKALKQKQLDLLALQEGRIKEQAPLFSDVQHMTRAMLPIFGRTS